MSIRSTLSRPLVVWIAYVLSRIVMLLQAGVASATGRTVVGDVSLVYWRVHEAVLSGGVPYRTVPFEYPPLSLPNVLLPPVHTSKAVYVGWWVAQMLVLDVLVLVALRRLGRAMGEPAGAVARSMWLWTLGGPLLFAVPLGRNDLVACVAIAWGFATLAEGRWRTGGGLLGAALMAKLWPAYVLILFAGADRPRRRILAAAAAVTGATVAPLVVGGLVGGVLRDVGRYHAERGIEVEAVVALPVLLANALAGQRLSSSLDHGSLNLVGYAGLVHATTVASVVVLLASVVAGARAATREVDLPRGAMTSVAVIAAVLVTGKVLSPQYLLWLVTLASIASAAGAHDRRVTASVVAATALTGVAFPVLFLHIRRGDLLPVVVYLLRDAAILCVCVTATIAARRRVIEDEPVPLQPVV